MIAAARHRVPAGRVTFRVADVVGWVPPQRFDTVFFAFWLSHVPAAAFGRFWSVVRGALAGPGELARLLAGVGWQADIWPSGPDWLLGQARPAR